MGEQRHRKGHEEQGDASVEVVAVVERKRQCVWTPSYTPMLATGGSSFLVTKPTPVHAASTPRLRDADRARGPGMGQCGDRLIAAS